VRENHAQYNLNPRGTSERRSPVGRGPMSASIPAKAAAGSPGTTCPKRRIGVRVRPLQDAELLPQDHDFQKQLVARTDRSNEQDEQEPQRARHVPLVAEPQEFRAVNLVKLPKEEPSENLGCSRICSGQSTKEQEGSTEVGGHALSLSIQSSYFHSVSTGFHKRSDLLWEQRC
jgi:hypothetical protein